MKKIILFIFCFFIFKLNIFSYASFINVHLLNTQNQEIRQVTTNTSTLKLQIDAEYCLEEHLTNGNYTLSIVIKDPQYNTVYTHNTPLVALPQNGGTITNYHEIPIRNIMKALGFYTIKVTYEEKYTSRNIFAYSEKRVFYNVDNYRIQNQINQTQLLYPTENHIVQELYPIFHWTHPQINVHTQYIIWISKKPNPQREYLFTKSNISDNTLQYPTDASPLIPGEKYYWQIRILNQQNQAIGLNAGFSEVKSFIFNKNMNSNLALIFPNKQKINVAKSISFQWEKNTDVKYYQIQISKKKDFKELLYNKIHDENFLSIQVHSFVEENSKLYWKVLGFTKASKLIASSKISSFEVIIKNKKDLKIPLNKSKIYGVVSNLHHELLDNAYIVLAKKINHLIADYSTEEKMDTLLGLAGKIPDKDYLLQNNVLVIKTNTEGFYEVDVPEDLYQIAIYKDKHILFRSHVVATKNKAIEVNAELMPIFGAIQGRITDLDTGQPLGNVLVGFRNQYNYQFTTTNTEGIYFLPNLINDTYTIEVSLEPNYKEYNESKFIIKGQRLTKNFQLEAYKAGILNLSVLDSESQIPIPNAEINIEPIRVSSILTIGNIYADGVTNDNGTIEAHDLRIGFYRLYCTAPGLPKVYKDFKIQSGEITNLILDISNIKWKVEGKVEDPFGEPLPFTDVYVRGQPRFKKTRTDNFGNFTLNLPNGTYEIEFYLPGKTKEIKKIHIENKDITIKDSILLFNTRGTFYVQINNKQTTIKSYTILIEPGNYSFTNNSSSKVKISLPGNTQYRISIHLNQNSNLYKVLPQDIFLNGAEEVNVNFTVDKFIILKGKVTNLQNEAISNVSIQYTNIDTLFYTNDQGEFKIEVLEAPVDTYYHLKFIHPKYITLKKDILFNHAHFLNIKMPSLEESFSNQLFNKYSKEINTLKKEISNQILLYDNISKQFKNVSLKNEWEELPKKQKTYMSDIKKAFTKINLADYSSFKESYHHFIKRLDNFRTQASYNINHFKKIISHKKQIFQKEMEGFQSKNHYIQDSLLYLQDELSNSNHFKNKDKLSKDLKQIENQFKNSIDIPLIQENFNDKVNYQDALNLFVKENEEFYSKYSKLVLNILNNALKNNLLDKDFLDSLNAEQYLLKLKNLEKLVFDTMEKNFNTYIDKINDLKILSNQINTILTKINSVENKVNKILENINSFKKQFQNISQYLNFNQLGGFPISMKSNISKDNKNLEILTDFSLKDKLIGNKNIQLPALKFNFLNDAFKEFAFLFMSNDEILAKLPKQISQFCTVDFHCSISDKLHPKVYYYATFENIQKEIFNTSSIFKTLYEKYNQLQITSILKDTIPQKISTQEDIFKAINEDYLNIININKLDIFEYLDEPSLLPFLKKLESNDLIKIKTPDFLAKLSNNINTNWFQNKNISLNLENMAQLNWGKLFPTVNFNAFIEKIKSKTFNFLKEKINIKGKWVFNLLGIEGSLSNFKFNFSNNIKNTHIKASLSLSLPNILNINNIKAKSEILIYPNKIKWGYLNFDLPDNYSTKLAGFEIILKELAFHIEQKRIFISGALKLPFINKVVHFQDAVLDGKKNWTLTYLKFQLETPIKFNLLLSKVTLFAGGYTLKGIEFQGDFTLSKPIDTNLKINLMRFDPKGIPRYADISNFSFNMFGGGVQVNQVILSMDDKNQFSLELKDNKFDLKIIKDLKVNSIYIEKYHNKLQLSIKGAEVPVNKKFNVAGLKVHLQAISFSYEKNIFTLILLGGIELNIPSVNIQVGNFKITSNGQFSIDKFGFKVEQGWLTGSCAVEYGNNYFHGTGHVKVLSIFSATLDIKIGGGNFRFLFGIGARIPIGPIILTQIKGGLEKQGNQFIVMLGATFLAMEILKGDFLITINSTGFIFEGSAALTLSDGLGIPSLPLGNVYAMLDTKRGVFKGNATTFLKVADMKITESLFNFHFSKSQWGVGAHVNANFLDIFKAFAGIAIGYNYESAYTFRGAYVKAPRRVNGILAYLGADASINLYIIEFRIGGEVFIHLGAPLMAGLYAYFYGKLDLYIIMISFGIWIDLGGMVSKDSAYFIGSVTAEACVGFFKTSMCSKRTVKFKIGREPKHLESISTLEMQPKLPSKINIEGIIQSNRYFLPIPNAKVALIQKGQVVKSTTSNHYGAYSFKDISTSTGAYLIRASKSEDTKLKERYVSKDQKITIKHGLLVVKRNIQLEAISTVTKKITIKVQDIDTAQIIDKADIFISSPNSNITINKKTNFNGIVHINKLYEKDKLQIDISKFGYHSSMIEHSVTDNLLKNHLTISLKKVNTYLIEVPMYLSLPQNIQQQKNTIKKLHNYICTQIKSEITSTNSNAHFTGEAICNNTINNTINSKVYLGILRYKDIKSIGNYQISISNLKDIQNIYNFSLNISKDKAYPSGIQALKCPSKREFCFIFQLKPFKNASIQILDAQNRQPFNGEVIINKDTIYHTDTAGFISLSLPPMINHSIKVNTQKNQSITYQNHITEEFNINTQVFKQIFIHRSDNIKDKVKNLVEDTKQQIEKNIPEKIKLHGIMKLVNIWKKKKIPINEYTQFKILVFLDNINIGQANLYTVKDNESIGWSISFSTKKIINKISQEIYSLLKDKKALSNKVQLKIKLPHNEEFLIKK